MPWTESTPLCKDPELAGAIGARIVYQRSLRDCTQKDLAAQAGISAPMLCRIEYGKRLPNIAIVVRIADALGCTTDDLLRG